MLSLPKILLTLALLGLVFYFGRRLARSADKLMRRPADDKPVAGPVELAKCDACGTYVGADSAACGRADCPRRA